MVTTVAMSNGLTVEMFACWQQLSSVWHCEHSKFTGTSTGCTVQNSDYVQTPLEPQKLDFVANASFVQTTDPGKGFGTYNKLWDATSGDTATGSDATLSTEAKTSDKYTWKTTGNKCSSDRKTMSSVIEYVKA